MVQEIKNDVLIKDKRLLFSNISEEYDLQNKRAMQLFTTGLLKYDCKQNTSSFTLEEFREVFGISHYQNKHIKLDAKDLLILSYNEGVGKTNLVSSVKCQNGKVIICWGINLDELVGLSEIKRPVILNVDAISNFKRVETWLLYEDLKSKYSDTGKYVASLSYEECRKILGCEESDKYKKANDFKRFVLDEAVKEINKHSELQLSIKTLKNNKRKIEGFELKITVRYNSKIEKAKKEIEKSRAKKLPTFLIGNTRREYEREINRLFLGVKNNLTEGESK